VRFREQADLVWALGPTILRVETAAIAAAAIVLSTPST
jgi:16S rRNA U1498 N3-methylase RsmE